MAWHDECPHGFKAIIHKETDAEGQEWTIHKAPEDCVICERGKVLTRYIKGEDPRITEEMIMTPFVAVLSGGQDSTTSLAWALKAFGKHEKTAAVFFDYGQKHLRAEESAAQKVAQHYGVELHTIPVLSLGVLGDSSLLDHSRDVNEKDPRNGLPSSFTPGRNLLFLSLAAALGYKLGHPEIQLVTGVCQTDYSGYPDCRAQFIDSLEHTIAQAFGMHYKQINIAAPLMYKTKAESVELMQSVDDIKVLGMTHTCYNGQTPPCGKCPACELRAKGFEEAGVADPLVAAAV